MATQSMSAKAGTVSTRQMVRDLGLWLAHAVLAGVVIGLACSAVVTLIAVFSA